ncbi:Protein transport protein SEC31 [Auxenochlorella protothecoides]|uniref:Protein transport protein SEC31 n=1 Tax=Auxenochlorella protothecoides TaxID=3075 RepID=A0A087SDJ9_AUXPR|nr:Protein transport protein SEC31 [Auxenochlorella protothecoides]KFM23803.1 Protein transport protein SEC31 [Auxenochlorella protothecoides]
MLPVKSVDRSATICFDPTGSFLAAGSVAGAIDLSFSTSSTLEIFDLDLANPSTDLKPAGGAVHAPERFSRLTWGKGPDPDKYPKGLLAGGLADGVICLWNPAGIMSRGAGSKEAQPLARLQKHRGAARGLQFNSHSPNLLASGGGDGELCIWDMGKPSAPSLYPAMKNGVEEVASEIGFLAWNPSIHHVLATCTGKSGVVGWDLKKQRPIFQLAEGGARRRHVSVAAWNPAIATQVLVASDDDGQPGLLLWDLRSPAAPLRELTGHSRGVLGLSWSTQDAGLILSSGKDNRTLVWDVAGCGAPHAELGAAGPATNWNFEVAWASGRNAGLFAAATFEGRGAVASGDREALRTLCARRAAELAGTPEAETWAFLGTHYAPDARRYLLERLGFGDDLPPMEEAEPAAVQAAADDVARLSLGAASSDAAHPPPPEPPGGADTFFDNLNSPAFLSARLAYMAAHPRPFMRLVAGHLRGDWRASVAARPPAAWRETLALLLSSAPPAEFEALASALAARLAEAGDAHAAGLCVVCAGDVDAAVGGWSAGLGRMPPAAALEGVVEKALVLGVGARGVGANPADGGAALAAPALVGLLTRYADVLVADGRLADAARFLDLVPPGAAAGVSDLRDRIAHSAPRGMGEDAAARLGGDGNIHGGGGYAQDGAAADYMYAQGAADGGYAYAQGAADASYSYAPDPSTAQAYGNYGANPGAAAYAAPPPAYGAPPPAVFAPPPAQAPSPTGYASQQSPGAYFAPQGPPALPAPQAPPSTYAPRGVYAPPAAPQTFAPAPSAGPAPAMYAPPPGPAPPAAPATFAPQPTYTPQPSQQTYAPPAGGPPPGTTLLSADTSGISPALRPVVMSLTNLFRACEAAFAAQPGRARELDDAGRRLGLLAWRLAQGGVSDSVAGKLGTLCAALDAGDVQGAARAQAALTRDDWDESAAWLSALKRLIKLRQMLG